MKYKHPLKMNRIIFLLVGFFISVFAYSQRSYMIYIQSENGKPFFLNYNDKISGSSPGGYIILSQLKDTLVQFRVGFPDNQTAEQQFAIQVQSSDHGYLLKNFGDKGWGLFDLQSLAVTMSESGNYRTSLKLNDQTSSFTNLLSKASGDSMLLYSPDIKKDEIKLKEVVSAVPKEDSVPLTKSTVNTTTTSTTEINKEIENIAKEPVKADAAKTSDTEIAKLSPPPVREEKIEKPLYKVERETERIETKSEYAPVVYRPSQIIRKSESSTTEGFGLIYIDKYLDGRQDTIRLLIENNQKYNLVSSMEPSDSDKGKTVETISPQKLSTNCKEVADDNDFLKLRKRMAAESNEGKMFEEAKKTFRSKCFTTEQLKNLSALFLTSLNKYNFFTAAYPYTSDKINFPSLESELKEEYYKVRFKSIAENK